MTSALAAFQAVDFNWTRALRDIWADPPYHVDEINHAVVDAVIDEFVATTARADSNPIGQVIQGRAGAGKTHLIGTLRRRVWEREGWFVLIDIVAVTDFWQTAALSFVESLHQAMPNGRLQYQAAIDAVLQRLFDDANARSAIANPPKEPLTRRTATDLFLAMLRRLDPINAPRHQDVVRALVFLDSKESDESNFAYMWLQGQNVDDELRRRLRLLTSTPRPVDIVRGLLWLLSLAGPTMIAVDQIDAIVSASNRADEAAGTDDSEAHRASALIEALALGLIDLPRRQTARDDRHLVPGGHVADPDRSGYCSLPRPVPHVAGARAGRPGDGRGGLDRGAARQDLCGGRLHTALSDLAVPARGDRKRRRAAPTGNPHRCDEHRRACLAAGRVTECASLAEPRAPTPAAAASPSRLDVLFEQEKRAADPRAFGSDETADAQRLVHLCELYLGHLDLPDAIDGEVRPDADRKAPPLHATLAFVFHDQATGSNAGVSAGSGRTTPSRSSRV